MSKADARKTRLGLPGKPKTVSQIAEQLETFRLTGSRTPRQNDSSDPAPKKNRVSLYDPAAKPLVDDPIGAIVFANVAPDAVLAKVRNVDSHVSLVGVKRASRPIDYLRDRSSNPISGEQYKAAEQFLADHEMMGRVGSNTAATIAHLESSVPWTRRDFEVKEAGDMMPYGTVTKLPKDVSDAMLQAAFRKRRMLQRLSAWERSVLSDLILSDYPVGVIAQRWAITLEAASTLVRIALWNLVKIYEETNAEFRSWLVAERSLNDQS